MLAFVATALLAVGVYRLVQHADRATGYEPPTVDLDAERARRDELERQARAPAALAAAADSGPVRTDGDEQL